MTRGSRSRSRLALAVVSVSLAAHQAAAQVVLDPALHFLGSQAKPEWTDLAHGPREGPGLTVRFDGRANSGDQTLFVRQHDVRQNWDVRLNGKVLGRLSTAESDLVHALAVPAGTLHDGANVLEVGPPRAVDDALIGELTLDPRPMEKALGQCTLHVQVTEAISGVPIPCRLTIADDRGVLAPLDTSAQPGVAIRAGTAYTAGSRVALHLRPGRYVVYATRGFEYSRAMQSVTLGEGQSADLVLPLRHEVPTPGLVACDTHLHTLTYSGHGDASLDERIATVCGEGIELPVATEHNHWADYDAAARRLNMRSFFTAVIGDEVTTAKGHFNAFPFALADRVPDAKIGHWPDLMRAIRAGAPGRVVILNHPRDVHAGFRPFGRENFNAAVGEDRNGVPYGFDAVEVVNSGALQSDPMQVVRDWLALWNHGQQPTAVGASDSHDVVRFLAGQARTYIACRDDDPANIDVDEACRNLRAGRAVVSFGLLAQIKVAGRFESGDLATGLGSTIDVAVRVSGPSWVTADRVELFANGTRIKQERLAPAQGTIEKGVVQWTLPRPAHDVALVAIASGPGVSTPFWQVPRPYQPSSTQWEPRLLAITNPVRLDADGNGAWNSPRYYAQFIMEIFGSEPTTLFRALGAYDEAVAAQTAAFCLSAGREGRDPAFARALEAAPEVVRRGFAAFEASSDR